MPNFYGTKLAMALEYMCYVFIVLINYPLLFPFNWLLKILSNKILHKSLDHQGKNCNLEEWLADSYLLYDYHICPFESDLLGLYSRVYFFLLQRLWMNSLIVAVCHTHLTLFREPNLVEYFSTGELAFISSDIYHDPRPAAWLLFSALSVGFEHL